MHIGVGLSLEKDPLRAAKEATALANININHQKIDLALVFSSIDFAYSNILKAISSSLKENVPILGSSSAAVITNQGIYKHGVAVMLLGLPQGAHFSTACINGIKARTPLKAGMELGEKLLYGFKDIPRVLSVIFSDGLIEDSSNLVHGLQERLGRSFPLVGASASDNLTFLRTYIYFNKEILNDSAAGILFGGKVNFGLGINHGWRPLGKQCSVTKSKGNIIYEINGLPAAKVYENYLSCNLLELQKELKRISVLYPFGVYLAGEEEYLLRNILSIEKDGSLRLQGNVTEGSLIRLMISTKESCLQATKQAAEEAKKSFIDSSADLKKLQKNNFVLVFNSLSRYILLRRDAYKELEIIKETFGQNTPIIGLYTYGEQAPLRSISYEGQTYCHNQTVGILTIGG